MCDPESATCVAPKATCAGSVVTDTVTGSTKDCAPYRCASRGTCLRRCSTSDDCTAGTSCADAVCTSAVAAEDEGACSISTSRRPGSGVWMLLALAAASALRLRRRVSVDVERPRG